MKVLRKIQNFKREEHEMYVRRDKCDKSVTITFLCHSEESSSDRDDHSHGDELKGTLTWSFFYRVALKFNDASHCIEK